MSSPTASAIVVGAGIVGAACARALALEGVAVTVIDGRSTCGGATAAGMGHLVVMDDSPAQFALTARSQQLWDELRPQLPASAEFSNCGTLWVAADDQEQAEVARKHQFYSEHSVASEILDAGQLFRAEPQLRRNLAGALRVPGDSVIYPPCAAAWLLAEAQRVGAQLRIGTAVAAIETTGVQLEDGSRIATDYVVNAAGTDAARLTPGLPIRPRKGHLVITDRYPNFVRHQVLELGYLKSAHGSDQDSVAFNVQPRTTGQLLIGSSRQFDLDTPQVDQDILSRMVRRAIHYLPALERVAALRVWTGLRAATPDSLPLVGPHPDMPNVLIAAGHEGLGIATSLGTAELIADHVLGRTAKIPLEPYLPGRFAGVAAHA